VQVVLQLPPHAAQVVRKAAAARLVMWITSNASAHVSKSTN